MAERDLPCIIDGCERRRNCKGLCQLHRNRLLATGDPLITSYDILPAKIQIYKALDSDTDDCIDWDGGTRGGYGRLSWKSKDWQAHRLIATLAHGKPKSNKMLACHKPLICHNRLCINPRHIYWGTAKQNSADARADGTIVRGTKSHNNKITESDVRKIREDTRGLKEIGNEYGLDFSTISKIKRRVRWSHVA